jgi:carbamoyl-phosphate synthase large subunit
VPRKRAGLTIAISGVGALQPGGPVARAIRAAPGFRGRLIGLSYDPLDPLNYEPGLIDEVILMPYPQQGAAHMAERLLHLHARQPIDVLLPTLDSELPVLIALAPRLAEAGIRVVLPTAEMLALRSKAQLPELARRTGLRVPHTRAAYSIEAARKIADEFRYPLMVKGQLYGAARVENVAQLTAVAAKFIASWGVPVMLQQMVWGIEYDVVVLGGRRGELLGAVAMKKLQLDDNGKAWGGVTVTDPGLDRTVAQAMKGLRWPGIFELELMREDRTGLLYLIEVNPRVPAWVALAVAAGQNLPWALVKLALGRPVAPMRDYTAGTMTLRQCFDVTAPMHVFEQLAIHGELSHAGAPRPLRLPRVPSAGTAAATARRRRSRT